VPVKKRPYRSPIRDEQAAQTRARILQSAGELFETTGYARTTVTAMARRAGVAPDTIYATFGNKARVLTAVIDDRLGGSTGAASVLDRPQVRAVRDETDQRRQLRAFARDIAELSEKVRPVYEIMRTASAVEPKMAEIHAEMDSYRLQNMRQVAAWLAANGPLRVDVERAGETIWAVASPDVARMLCDRRGWTRDQYAAWLEDTLVRALLVEDV
jgi:AcrR family transcriptional regulator